MVADKRQTTFKKWLSEHQGLVFKVVRVYAATPEDQEDLLQQILMQLWCSIPAFRGNAAVSTWVYRVALNTALVWNRSEKKRRISRISFIDFSRTPVPKKAQANPVEDSQMVVRLYEAIRKLPKVDASLVLMYLEGLSYNRMAEILGISESNVGVKLNRAKSRLAELLKGYVNES